MSLTEVVQEKNMEIEKDFQMYWSIERKQKQRYKKLEEVDCAGMLQTANVQIKVMNQLLDRLIPEDDTHTVINEGKSYSIEVIPQNLMSFRVPCKNANAPAKFFISFEGMARQGSLSEDVNGQAAIGPGNKDLRIFVSQEEKEPREGHCDRSYFFKDSVITINSTNK